MNVNYRQSQEMQQDAGTPVDRSIVAASMRVDFIAMTNSQISVTRPRTSILPTTNPMTPSQAVLSGLLRSPLWFRYLHTWLLGSLSWEQDPQSSNEAFHYLHLERMLLLSVVLWPEIATWLSQLARRWGEPLFPEQSSSVSVLGVELRSISDI